jgi:cytochrome d ubiquinol oxidase subunit II
VVSPRSILKQAACSEFCRLLYVITDGFDLGVGILSLTRSIWDRVFGIGSLLAAARQGVIRGKVITGMLPGDLHAGLVAMTAIGVVSGYALLGAAWVVKKTTGRLEAAARRYAMIAVVTTVAAAIVISIGTLTLSPIGAQRWAQAGVFHVLVTLAIIAALAFCYVLYSVHLDGGHGPFNASIVLFVASFAGLAVSLFPYIVPGQLSIASAASNSSTLIFMLIGIGTVMPIMIGYNLYQYHLFRGKVIPGQH